ncbi:MAG: ATP synthase F1 subunit gamma [Bacteroidota bacterium]|nr:ATP synthase F1 subunit gamma [Bacteroidota bacterium]MDP4233455.1 ATP synthase F1 subunit gamma [Bacteroidota bacterium]MDP4242321.1 ATP synthase F1 subunit gamma [Bacteroidota bacterium]MDP4287077.1 ATP synthase F1 subunit gamma [Bacteroidota bacterium]
MATLRDIRRRIAGVKSTSKITQAMKMVAAAKLRRAQDSINAARPYARALEHLLKELLRSASLEGARSPLLSGRSSDKDERVILIVVTSDRGLAGAFNSNLLKFTESRIRDLYQAHKDSGRLSIVPIGRRSTDYFTKRGYKIAAKYPGIFTKLEFDTARSITLFVSDLYNRDEADRVELLFNEFRSVVSQRPIAERLMPVLDPSSFVEGKGEPERDYIFEPDPISILNVLVPRHLETMLWRALLESNAAEQGARMTAMDSATRNARDLISALQLTYNKARQAAITKEILEISGGAEALAKG